MSEIFKYTKNTRPIIINSNQFIRSDVPCKIMENEYRWLKENNILTIIDLRKEQEQNLKPCPLKNNSCFKYMSLSVTGGNDIPETPSDVPVSYLKMCDEQMNIIINTIMSANTNVMYFCNAGKDRTGVVSAILLKKLGYDNQYIINDYLKSENNLKEMLISFAESNPKIDINVITPCKKYMDEFLTLYENKFSL